MRNKKIDLERFLEKIIWRLLKISNQTDTLAELDIGSPKYMNFYMKKFFEHTVKILLWLASIFFSILKFDS